MKILTTGTDRKQDRTGTGTDRTERFNTTTRGPCNWNMKIMLFELSALVTLLLTSESHPNVSLKEDRNLNLLNVDMSSMEPLCDVRTSYVFPQFGKNIFGKRRKLLRQRVRIVKCLGLNAGWALKNFVKAECRQNFVKVELFYKGTGLRMTTFISCDQLINVLLI